MEELCAEHSHAKVIRWFTKPDIISDFITHLPVDVKVVVMESRIHLPFHDPTMEIVVQVTILPILRSIVVTRVLIR